MPEYPILLTLQQAAKRSGRSEKTLRRWIKDGKLITYHGDERKPGDPYMIFPKDLDAATGGDKTKEWQIEQEVADLRMRVVMLESMVEELQGAVRAQQYDIEDLQAQVKSSSQRRQPRRSARLRPERPGARKIGLVDLSPHDCRHYWATNAVRTGTDIKSLQDAGCRSSLAMPLRYAEV